MTTRRVVKLLSILRVLTLIFDARVFSQVILVSLVLVASAAPGDDGAEKKPGPTVTAGDEPTTTSTTPPPPPPGREPKDVSILKQINKVNDDGSYTYGYEASDGSFKVETRDVAGNVKGMFGFVDEAGRLKRVSYSASNSSGFQAAGSTSSSPLGSSAAPTSSSSERTEQSSAVKPTAAATTGVKKVLVSKRPVLTAARDDETERRRREGSDPRRQLPRNDDGDAPDVYGGAHGRSSMESGPVSPVVSALMSELQLVPVRAYRPTAPQPPPTTLPATADAYDGESGAVYAHPDTISRQAQDDDEPQYRPVTVQYRKSQVSPAAFHQQQQPSALPTVVYQQQPVAYPTAAYGPNLVAFRDELMELILTFVQARISQLVSLAPPSPYANQPPSPLPLPSPYPMPYQQPNYYVPSYYQGPRMPASSRQPVGGFVLQQLPSARLQPQDDYAVAAAADAPQQSSPKVTQTLKDGLIRMLLSTSPRYDPDRNRDWSTPSATFRRTTQSTPVRSVQIVQDDDADSRPVTTESPD